MHTSSAINDLQTPPHILTDWALASDLDAASHALTDPALACVHIPRALPHALADLAQRCAARPERELTGAMAADEVALRAMFAALLGQEDLAAADAHLDALAHDAARLIATFLDHAGDRVAHVSLAITRQDECLRFHHDHMRMRMLCTYVGPGTQWLPTHAVHHHALANPHLHRDAIIADPHAILTAQPFDLVWMKGSRYAPEHPACVHRSPPIRSAQLTRLLLRISTPDSPLPYSR